ncbi:GPI-anchor transamidase subunit GAB1 [Rhodotorula paludigena]|uniref:GPI-anchor transamidase subunit GAB1 n=1 Tax=Rhodotorula paludigena TaxID=86838 RepID=UPI00316FEC85
MEAGVLAAGAALRAALALHPTWPRSLAARNELATPLSALQRLQEGHHLATHLPTPLNPYEAGAVHHPPLALALLGPLTDPHSPQPALSWAAWIAADVLTAWALARVADRRKRRPLVVDDGEQQWTGAWVAALYLFHPFAIATTLARSTTSFSNLFLALALSSAVEGSLITAAFHLSLATHLSLYPVLLLPPLILVVHLATNSPASSERAPRSRFSCAVEGVLAFVGHQAVLLALSRWLTGSWAFLSSVYGVILTIPDLTPNIGLAWYFFIEMFDHFRAFFLVVFALHPLAYVAPLTIHYRKDPLFAAVLLIGAISLLKSYPSLGDWSLWHALLGCYSELLPHVTSPLFHSLLPLYALLLLPSFSHLWLGSNSGNANFFYASTLVWAVAMGGWAVEAGKAWGRREAMRGLDDEGRAKVRSGEWKVVQR